PPRSTPSLHDALPILLHTAPGAITVRPLPLIVPLVQFMRPLTVTVPLPLRRPRLSWSVPWTVSAPFTESVCGNETPNVKLEHSLDRKSTRLNSSHQII